MKENKFTKLMCTRVTRQMVNSFEFWVAYAWQLSQRKSVARFLCDGWAQSDSNIVDGHQWIDSQLFLKGVDMETFGDLSTISCYRLNAVPNTQPTAWKRWGGGIFACNILSQTQSVNSLSQVRTWHASCKFPVNLVILYRRFVRFSS